MVELSADFKERYGPWAVIAGGSEGVGSCFATQLAEAGFSLVLLARRPNPLEETAAAARAYGVEVRTLSVDLTDTDAISRIREITDDLDIGLLICNAGANTYGHEFVSGDLDAFRGVLALSVDVPMKLTHHFGARLKERGHGGIILLGSMAGYSGMAQISVYAAAKAYLRVFAEGLWLEMREHNVDVLDLILGLTRTPAMERAGLNFDAGIRADDPADVAAQGLEHLGDGPAWHVGGNLARVEKLNTTDRATLLLGMQERSKALLPDR